MVVGIVYGPDRKVRRIVKSDTVDAVNVAATVQPDEAIMLVPAATYDLHPDLVGSRGLIA